MPDQTLSINVAKRQV